MRAQVLNLVALLTLSSTTLVKAASLPELALQKVLTEAAPIFGDYENTKTALSTWMASYPDSTPIVHMNLPGAHDADTWNYSQATQDALLPITNLNGIPPFPPEYYRCQDRSIVDMLNNGIRVFDLRPAFDVTNSTLVFYHSQALQSETATMDDVLVGFAQWLEDHPSEAVFLDFEWEGLTAVHASYNAAAQMAFYNALTTPITKAYILQTQGSFGTLGEARGKITLLRRFDLTNLPARYDNSSPGIHFSPSLWTDNDPDITLVFNSTLGDNGTAFIEDYYNILTPEESEPEENIQWKYNATTANIEKAASDQFPDSLFWTWASSSNTLNLPIPDTPQIMATGNGSVLTEDGIVTVNLTEGGVNNRLVPFLKGFKGKRVGIVMFDYFEIPGDLVPTLLGLLGPDGRGRD